MNVGLEHFCYSSIFISWKRFILSLIGMLVTKYSRRETIYSMGVPFYSLNSWGVAVYCKYTRPSPNKLNICFQTLLYVHLCFLLWSGDKNTVYVAQFPTGNCIWHHWNFNLKFCLKVSSFMQLRSIPKRKQLFELSNIRFGALLAHLELDSENSVPFCSGM